MSEQPTHEVFRRDVAALYRERGFSRYEEWMMNLDENTVRFLYMQAVKMFTKWTTEGEEPDE